MEQKKVQFKHKIKKIVLTRRKYMMRIIETFEEEWIISRKT